MKVFDQWRFERKEAVLKENYSGEPLIHESVNEMSEEQLDFVKIRFIPVVIREDGQEYPGMTLYEMIGSIRTYLRVQCKRNVTLIDTKGCIFRSLNSALNFRKNEKAAQGIGVFVNQAKFITGEQETKFVGKCLFLGSENW